MSRSRGYCFTINNPTGWDEADIEGLSTAAEYYVYGRETGEEGTPHLQGYVRFKNAISFMRIKQLLLGPTSKSKKVHVWKRPITARKMETMLNGVNLKPRDLPQSKDGLPFSPPLSEAISSTSETSSQESISDTSTVCTDSELETPPFWTTYKMSGGGDLLELENQDLYGSVILTTMRNSSINGGTGTTTKKQL